MVVARLPRAVKLNNTAISDSEREDAEQHFVREFMDSSEKPERFSELSETHQNVNKLTTLMELTINLRITFEGETTKMAVSTQHSSLHFKKTPSSHFGVPSKSVKLIIMHKGIGHEMKINRDFLRRYNFNDCDEILVMKK